MSFEAARRATPGATQAATTLDPADWRPLRTQAHRMLDDMLDHLESLNDQPVWREPSATARQALDSGTPAGPSALDDVYSDFKTHILPYGSGNIHPGFMGWVQGGGTPVGMLAEMLAGGMNVNAGGRNHMAIQVEQQIAHWMRDLFDYPKTANGLFLTGASQANFVAVLLARTRFLGADVRTHGLPTDRRLVAYASTEVHGCVPRAMEMAGIGSDNLRRIPVDAYGRMDTAALVQRIKEDKASGLSPFLIVATAGTVNTGAIDDLPTIAAVAHDHGLHFHIDGALGALGVMSAELKPLLRGIELSDSIAFDFHKWGQVPYDAGFLLVRDITWQSQTFAADAAYLTRADSGLAGGAWWPCDHGPDLSRGFRALKTWFTLKTYGTEALGRSMAANCALARYLHNRILAEPTLTLEAPVALNIVCFRRSADTPEAADRLNSAIVEHLHSAGDVAPSLTRIHGRRAIRAAIVNHRTTQSQIDTLVDSVLAFSSL